MFTHANMLILKVTRDCNLRCRYCYVHNKDQYVGERMDYGLFQNIVERIIEDKSRLHEKHPSEFSLIFHGGEPLLTEKKQLFKMIHYVHNRFSQSRMNFHIGMQTNLTLLDEEIAKFFSEYDVQIGVSFDGIKRSNRARSKIVNSAFFEEKFNLMHKYNLDFGILVVVNRENLHHIKQSTDYLVKKYNVRGFKVNYAENVNDDMDDSEVEVSGQEFFRYAMKPYVDEYISTGKTFESNMGLIINRFISYSLAFIRNRSKSNCGLKVCGGGIRIIEIEPTGKTFLCGRYSKEFPEAYMMHANDPDFLELKQLRKYLYFVQQKHQALLDAGCDICPADNICDHGCMAFYMSKYGRYGIRKELVCPMFKSLYDYLNQHAIDIILSYFEHHKENNACEINLHSPMTAIRSNSGVFRALKYKHHIDIQALDETKIRLEYQPK